MANYRFGEYEGPWITGHPAVDWPALTGFIRGDVATSTTTTTTIALSSATHLVLCTADSGMLVAYGSSTATAPTMTSTTAQNIPANVAPVALLVNPYGQLFVAST